MKKKILASKNNKSYLVVPTIQNENHKIKYHQKHFYVTLVRLRWKMFLSASTMYITVHPLFAHPFLLLFSSPLMASISIYIEGIENPMQQLAIKIIGFFPF